MAAYYLQKAGKHVIVLEALRLLEGTTGYTTAKVTLLHGLKYDFLISTFGEEAARAYVDSNRWAIDALEKIISEESIDCDFRRVSGFVFTQEKDQVKKIEHECNALKKLGQPAVLRDAQIGLLFPSYPRWSFLTRQFFIPLHFCCGWPSYL